MIKKSLWLLLLLMILITAISAVSASDLNMSDVQTEDAQTDDIQMADINQEDDEGQADSNEGVLEQSDSNQDVLSEIKTFRNLNVLINNNSDSEIVLEDDYKYYSSVDGAYESGIVIDRVLTIDGNGHTIDGSAKARAFDVTGSNVIFKNIKFIDMGDPIKYSQSGTEGGAILSDYNLNTKVFNSTFYGCYGNLGGALEHVDAENCTFNACKAYLGGGAMYAGTAKNCTFIKCHGREGGAVDSVNAFDCYFYENYGGKGGAMFQGIATNCTFANNTGSLGGAFAAFSQNDAVIGCIFINNYADVYGGAFYASYLADVVNCTFINNTADKSSGAVHCGDIIFCRFEGNYAPQYPDYDDTSSLISIFGYIDNGYAVDYPNPINLPIILKAHSFRDYYFYGINTTVTVSKSGIRWGTFTCLSCTNLTLDLPAGSYQVRAVFDLPNNRTTSGSGTIKVNGIPTKLNVSSDQPVSGLDNYLNVTLMDDTTGEALPGYEILAYIKYPNASSKVNESLITDENGQIRIPFQNLTEGKYSYEFVFCGEGAYENSFRYYYDVNIRKLSVDILSDSVFIYSNETANINATLLDEFGDSLAGYNVSVTLRNMENFIGYNCTTDENGQININLPRLCAGNYSIEIGYAGTVFINGIFKTFNLTIKQIETMLDSSSAYDLIYGEGEIAVQLADEFANRLANRDVILNIGDLSFTQKTDELGHAYFDLSGLDEGFYPSSILFIGDGIYSGCDKIVNISISKIDTIINADNLSFVYGEYESLIAYLSDVYGNSIENTNLKAVFDVMNLTSTTGEYGMATFDWDCDLTYGIYDGTIYFEGAGKYRPTSAPVRISVNKVPTRIMALNGIHAYGDQFTVKAFLNDLNSQGLAFRNVSISIGNVTLGGITDERGHVEFLIEDCGFNVASIYFAGDDNYDASSATANIDVFNIPTEIIATDVNCMYGDSEYLVVTLKDAYGNYIQNHLVYIIINSTVSNRTTDENGQAKFLIGLDADAYVANIFIEGDEHYLRNYAIANVVVNRLQTEITATNLTYTYGESKYLVVTLKDAYNNRPLRNETVSISIGNGNAFSGTTDYFGQVRCLLKLQPKSYVLTISYAGNTNYIGSSTTASIVVSAVPVETVATSLTCEYKGKNLVLTLMDENNNYLKNQLIHVMVGDLTFDNVTNEWGRVVIALDLPSSYYNVYAFFDGNDNYANSSAGVRIHVNNDPLATNLTCEYNAENHSLIVTLKDSSNMSIRNQVIHLTIANNTWDGFTDYYGQIEFTLKLAPKSYDVSVVYDGNDNYLGSSASLTIAVDTNPEIIATNLTCEFVDNRYLVVTLKDENNNRLKDQQVHALVGGNRIDGTTNNLGEAWLLVDLNPESYNVSVAFNGNGNYAASSVALNIVVNKIQTSINAPSLNYVYDESHYLVVTLKDSFGAILKNETISVTIGNNVFNGKTDYRGQASFLLKVQPNSYVANVSYAGNAKYLGSSSISNIIVNKIKTSIVVSSVKTVYNGDKYVLATLKDSKGHVIAGQKVVISLNGKNHALTTNSKGQVKVTANNLAPKTYSAKVTFSGDKYYANSAKSVKVTVTKANPKLTASSKAYTVKATKKYAVVLKTNKNVVMKNTKVTVKVNGKVYTAKTNAKGQATFTLSKLTKKGSFKAVVSYGGSSYYNKISKSVTIRVK